MELSSQDTTSSTSAHKQIQPILAPGSSPRSSESPDIFIHQPQSIRLSHNASSSIADSSLSSASQQQQPPPPLLMTEDFLLVPQDEPGTSTSSVNSIRRTIGQLLSRSSSSLSVVSASGHNHNHHLHQDNTGTSPSHNNTGHQILNKVSGYFSPFHSRSNSSSSAVDDDEEKKIKDKQRSPATTRRHTTVVPTVGDKLSIPVDEKDNLRSYTPTKVKETRHVYVDYDPVSRRKVLNTYEILKDLGRGQHGKVKLAKDMLSNRLVLIKIVDRKSKPKFGKLIKPGNSQEEKIRKEIAIMKKCDHPHVVKLIEVLDDASSRKIYLVLEYLEKGEIHWQNFDEITHEPKPVLKFHEAQNIFRDVILGLEYLHYQGIIHRDIKPANLLVSLENVVKISDFGVSFASSLDYDNNEYELCKTAGTPAFLAPELCQTEVLSLERELKVDHKIDIWALGVTLFCLLFGKLPFNSDSEFKLFEVINNEELKIPPKSALVELDQVSDFEWEMTVDLLHKLLTKNPQKRIDIPEIKQHEFFLYGLTKVESAKYTIGNDSIKLHVSNEEVNYAVVGIGNKIKKKLVKALKKGFISPEESSPTDSKSPELLDSTQTSNSSSSKQLATDGTRSVILSEALSPPEGPSPGLSTPRDFSLHHPQVLATIRREGERRGSADLIETKEFLEGSFKKPTQGGALEHILKLSDSRNNSRKASVDHNTFLSEESTSRQNSIDHSSSFAAFDRRSKVRLNSSFASLDSFHEDNNVIDFSSYVPVDYKGKKKSADSEVKFNKVKYNLGGESSEEEEEEDGEHPKMYEPTTSSSSVTRRGSKYSYSSYSSGSSLASAFPTSGASPRPLTPIVSTLKNPPALTPKPNSPTKMKKSNFFSLHDSDEEDSDEGVAKTASTEEEEDDDDDKELMFAFGPKSEPPPFLRSRVMSYESNIPSTMRPASMNNLSSTYDHSEYVMPSSSSTVDLPEEFQHFIPELKDDHATQLPPVSSPLKISSTSTTSYQDHDKFLSSSIETIKNQSRVSSPLANNAPASPKATVSSHLVPETKRKDLNLYKNHYSKDHNIIPFEKAHHLHNRGANSDVKEAKLHRNNSITIGLLQFGHEQKKEL